MNETFEWVLMLVAIAIGIIGAVNKNKKKAAEAAQKAKERMAGNEAGEVGEGMHPGRSRRTLADVLIELAERTADEEPASPTVAPRPVATPVNPTWRSQSHGSGRPTAESPRPAMPLTVSNQPEATSYDYYSLETEYDAMDGRGYGDRNVIESEVAAYERLAAERAHRTIYAEASSGVASVSASAKKPFSDGSTKSSDGQTVSEVWADAKIKEDDAPGRNSIGEILGDEFDLRRAVIEAEILNPKYR